MGYAEHLTQAAPSDACNWFLLGYTSRLAGNSKVSLDAYQKGLARQPNSVEGLSGMAQTYIRMGKADEAVTIYSKIAEINPADLTAVKRSKDAAATASMNSGGWDTAQSYRDLMKNKDEAISLEQKSRVVKSVDMIDEQLGELTPQWEAAQDNVDLTKRIAKLWEDRFEQKQDEESLNGAFYYYTHTNELVGGADPAVARKLSSLNLQRVDLRVKSIEDWLAQGGAEHDEAEAYRTELEDLKAQRAESLISEAKKRVERNPTDLQLRFELGEQLVKARQYTEAIQELQRAKQNPNARLKAMNLLGQCYTEKNMLDLAVKQFQEAAAEIVGMDATKKEILYKLGLVFERMGKKDDSLNCMKAIYEVDYGYLDVAQRVEQSYGT